MEGFIVFCLKSLAKPIGGFTNFLDLPQNFRWRRYSLIPKLIAMKLPGFIYLFSHMLVESRMLGWAD